VIIWWRFSPKETHSPEVGEHRDFITTYLSSLAVVIPARSKYVSNSTVPTRMNSPSKGQRSDRGHRSWLNITSGPSVVTKLYRCKQCYKNIFLVCHSKLRLSYVRFEVFTAVTMKNGVFWVVTPCGSCKNWRFGGTWHLLHQGDKSRWTRNNTSCN
jgi:hypothetical protein